ncbi:MAG: methyltransferase domain-containing protein [Actinobacteria bacterium]|nr:MAG: methyltransferase domain-containing protein [Actinomycetota bacterium]
MGKLGANEKRDGVRKRYAEIAKQETSSCCSPDATCKQTEVDLEKLSVELGYSVDDLKDIPTGANMGLGCGNPHAIAALKGGEIVLDLGSGGGFDCFLAARKVGKSGKVIGIDMTPEMIYKARMNTKKSGHDNVEFRLGEIENLPVADNHVDVILSNCVINLSPNKPQVYLEAFRVLKPGGRISISDVVAITDLPQEIKDDLELLSKCASGAATAAEIKEMLTNAGFINIKVAPKEESKKLVNSWDSKINVGDYVLSATIEAIKPCL